MTRFVNPAKIGLLTLIELYMEEAVPDDAILPILSFITSHLVDLDYSRSNIDPATRWSRAEDLVSLVVSIKDFEKLLGSYPFLMGMPGRKLWDQFLGKLWAINSLDALHEFLDGLRNMVVMTREERKEAEEDGEPLEEEEEEEEEGGIKMSRNSLFGAFVRRVRMEYKRMQFDDVAELWKDFVRYRQPTAHYLKKKVPGFGRLSFDSVLHLGEQVDWEPQGVSDLVSVTYGDMVTGEDTTSALPVSTEDILALLEFQIEHMQKFGIRVPLEIQKQFHDLLNDSHIIPSKVYYLKFLDAWRGGDYVIAFDLLHRYFDYTMENRDRHFYQYALMNLAVLQGDFGCAQDAIRAMLECVTVARENRDMTCLNFSLNWLFHFGRDHPHLLHDLETQSMLGTVKQTLTFLRIKARDRGQWALWSASLLTEAKLNLMHSDSLATALESMVRSSHLIVSRNLKHMFGAQLALAAGVWDRIGLTKLTSNTCEVFLRCHLPHCVFDDQLKFTCRASMLLAARGQYDEALAKMEGVPEKALRSWRQNGYWHTYRGIIQLARDLRHHNLDGAEHMLSQLRHSTPDDLEPDMSFFVDTLRIECWTRRGDYPAAFAKVAELLRTLVDDRKDVGYRIRLLLIKASLFDKVGRPRRGFTTAMRAASLSWRARMMPTLWAAMGALCNILVSMGEFQAASDLLAAIIPRALECEGCGLPARLYAYLADALMGLAGGMEPESAGRGEYLSRAVEAVQRSFDLYAVLEDAEMQCQTMAKKAVMMKLSGDVELAAACAATYVSLRERARGLRGGW